MKKLLIVSATAALVASLSVPALARTDVSFGVFVGVPGVAYVPPPVVYAPAPVYYAPQPRVYYAPRPVYYAPPAPVYYHRHGHHTGWYGRR